MMVPVWLRVRILLDVDGSLLACAFFEFVSVCVVLCRCVAVSASVSVFCQLSSSSWNRIAFQDTLTHASLAHTTSHKVCYAMLARGRSIMRSPPNVCKGAAASRTEFSITYTYRMW